jgi:zinc finger HIT domain-containing protein 3
VFTARPQLKDVLRAVDGLRGAAREEALQRGLGVMPIDTRSRTEAADSGVQLFADEEDRNAFRALAEAVEHAVRGEQGGLGLDWDS